MVAKLERARSLQGSLALLKLADYRILLLSNTLWWQELFMEMIVMGWLVLELTDSPWALAVVGFCRSLPLLLFGFFTGPVIDRFGRRPVIVATQTATFLAYMLIAILVALQAVTVWQLALLSFVLGSGWALEWPARRALLPDLVGREKTVDAIMLESFVQGIARILGPFLAGLLVARYGSVGCVSVMALSAGISLFIVRALSQHSIPRTTMKPNESPWTVLGQGLNYVVRNRPILAVLLITAAMNLFIFPYMNLLPVFARDILGRGPAGLGVLGMATGVGSFIGLIVINWVRRYVSNGWIFTVGTGFSCVMLCAFAISTNYALSCSLLLLAGIGQACFAIMQSSIILLAANDEMRSQAMGTLVLAIGTDPLGKVEIGILAENYGAPLAVGLNAGLAALTIVVIGVAIPSLRTPIRDRA